MKPFLYFFLILSVNFSASAQLKMAPTRLVADAEHASTHKLFVENTGDKPVRVKINAFYQTFSNSQDPSRKRLNTEVEKLEDISQYIKISPPIIARLKPRQRRAIRVRLSQLPAELPAGQYRTYIEFVPVALDQKQKKAMNEANGMAMQLDFVIKTLIPIYVERGENKLNVALKCSENKVQIINHGLAQVSGLLHVPDEANSDEQMQQSIFLVRQSEISKPVANSVGAYLEVAEQEVARCL